ncbi:MAG: Yip1 family protein, partial [Elainella sp.]
MTDPALSQLGDLIGGSFSLNREAFSSIVTTPSGRTIALWVVLLAGLSLGIGQSIILFINQVKPIRFLFSLLLNAILFVFGFLFLVLSTWLIGLLPGLTALSLEALVRSLGLSYAPLLFSFLGALPYAGVPILNLLSVWHLLAMVVGVSAAAQVGASTAFTHVAFGWVALQLLQNTIGQPIARLGQSLTRRVAGVELVNRRSELRQIVQSGLETRLATGTPSGSTALEVEQNGGQTRPKGGQGDQPSERNGGRQRSPEPLTFSQLPNSGPTAVLEMPSQGEADLGVRLEYWFQRIPQVLRLGMILLSMLLLFMVVALLLRPIRDSLFGWYEALPRLVRWVFDLTWIGIVALVFAGLLAPLEALGWWAGWYGDEVETEDMVPLPEQDQPHPVSRYVVYLDGVGQSGQAYTPDVFDFLEALEPALPPDMELVQGLMLYSVRNRPLVEDRPLAWVWRLADKMRWENPMALLGLLVNLRNAWIVAVSTDKRYGPIYNQGIAQVLYSGLMQRGYRSGTPLTLVGYSGGGQMSVAAAPYLKRVLGADIEVISLGGVMSANNNLLQLEHLYHLVGDKDGVAALGPVLFPGRRKWFPLSYWNRALRKGKISQISLGPVGHQVPGGLMDPNAFLPSGESYLQHTISVILSILEGRLLVAAPPRSKQTSNYEIFKQADFNDYSYYPLQQTLDRQCYQPMADWIGRLVLPAPAERRQLRGVWLEVHHAAQGYEALVGQRVVLRWQEFPIVKQWVKAVTHDVHFSVDAEYSSQYGGTIHPD